MNFFFEIWNEAIFFWEKGGILMPAIGILSLYTYFVAFDLWFRLRTILPKDIQSFPREKWGAFQGGGKINRIMHYCIGNHNNSKETRKKFQQVRKADSSYLSRRLRFLLACCLIHSLVMPVATAGLPSSALNDLDFALLGKPAVAPTASWRCLQAISGLPQPAEPLKST